MESTASQPQFRCMQIVGNLDIGGAQEVVRTLSAYLEESQCPTVVCTLRDGPLREEIERMGIPVEILPGRRYSILALPHFIGDMLRIRRGMASLVKKHNINVVQTHLLRTMDFLVLTLRFPFKQLLVFWTVHSSNLMLRADQIRINRNWWLLKTKKAAHRKLYKWASGQANGFVAVSADVERAIYQNYGPISNRVYVICNGVDTRRYRQVVDRESVRHALGFDARARLILVVGTLKEQKGHRYLIEAAGPLIKQNPNLHFLFAGDGDLRERLEAQVRADGLEKNIQFLGNRQDVPALLAASDYFVLPSLEEGLPMALIEAMASGLPVVATEVSGSQQVVTNGQTGLLVPPGDPAHLQIAISNLLADPQRARTMGQAARERVETFFGARKQAEEHLQMYRHEWKRSYQHETPK